MLTSQLHFSFGFSQKLEVCNAAKLKIFAFVGDDRSGGVRFDLDFVRRR